MPRPGGRKPKHSIGRILKETPRRNGWDGCPPSYRQSRGDEWACITPLMALGVIHGVLSPKRCMVRLSMRARQTSARKKKKKIKALCVGCTGGCQFSFIRATFPVTPSPHALSCIRLPLSVPLRPSRFLFLFFFSSPRRLFQLGTPKGASALMLGSPGARLRGQGRGPPPTLPRPLPTRTRTPPRNRTWRRRTRGFNDARSEGAGSRRAKGGSMSSTRQHKRR